MPSKNIHTNIDGQTITLSNLDKVLYPSIGITKAEMIQYYLKNAELLLEHIGNRALTVIRFPDGVGGTSFYSKDKPNWTPEWVSSAVIQHDDKVIDYILPKFKADIVWLANLACLELHPMQYRMDRDPFPDYFVFDLDPDEQLSFALIKEAAHNLKMYLERFNYVPFIKTSGGKGLHIYVPILPQYSFDVMIESVKELTKKFIRKYNTIYTLNLNKQKRKGKILIDIYRNHKTNTTVAPFSLRGKKGAPISMPFYWKDLDKISHAQYFTILNYKKYLDDNGYAWDKWQDQATTLYDQSKMFSISIENQDDRLQTYIQKRDLENTPEPGPIVSLNFKDAYVVQLHDASNLHYDLRLEDKGVLLSWAIPKGLPFEKGQKRLAIRTEDHPVQYLHFEGVIPKGEYGGGNMKIIESGKIKWLEKKDSSYSFSLSEENYENNYKLFRMDKENQWLITSDSDKKQIRHDGEELSPMLAESSKTVPVHQKYQYEVKWDGIRVLVYLQNNKIKIVSRNGNDLTAQFPELHNIDCFDLEHAVLDGEIVVLDEDGRPQFSQVISRMHKKGTQSISMLSQTKSVTCYLFDLLSLDGRSMMEKPLSRRRDCLEMLFTSNEVFRFSESFADGEALFEAIRSKSMEGIMAKNQSSIYASGLRSRDWLKVKCRKSDICFIIGYTAGKGDRSKSFGALHLVKNIEGELIYLGKVGTGFDDEKLNQINELLTGCETTAKPIQVKIEEEARTTWIKPTLKCEIKYASMSSNNTYREPVFVKLLHD